MTFPLAWQGNDGTSSSPSSISLPMHSPVDLAVSIAPTTAGAHTAILSLDHPSIPGHAYRVQTAIVPPLRFAAATHTLTAQLHLPRPGDRGIFVLVPAG